jgi:hypothetical protein
MIVLLILFGSKNTVVFFNSQIFYGKKRNISNYLFCLGAFGYGRSSIQIVALRLCGLNPQSLNLQKQSRDCGSSPQ